MSHNRPDWLGDDGEFKEPIQLSNTQTVVQKSKTSSIQHLQKNSLNQNWNTPNQHTVADVAAISLFIILLVGTICLYIFLLFVSIPKPTAIPQSTSNDRSSQQHHIEQCSIAYKQISNGVQHRRNPEEFDEATEYYYTHCFPSR